MTALKKHTADLDDDKPIETLEELRAQIASLEDDVNDAEGRADEAEDRLEERTAPDDVPAYMRSHFEDIAEVLNGSVGPFVAMSVLRSHCWGLENYCKRAMENTIPKLVGALNRALREHDGTEISETTLQELTEKIDNVQQGIDDTQKIFSEARTVHDRWARMLASESGFSFSSYGTASQNGNPQSLKTMSAMKAAELIQKYNRAGKRPKAEGGPTVYDSTAHGQT